jgi:hypothetical protein
MPIGLTCGAPGALTSGAPEEQCAIRVYAQDLFAYNRAPRRGALRAVRPSFVSVALAS